jgi:hypothetical protein
MRQLAVVGLVILASLAGCSHLRPSPSNATPAQTPVVAPRPPGASPASSPAIESGPDANASTSSVVPATALDPNGLEPTPAPGPAAERPVAAATPDSATPGRTSPATAAAVARPPGPPASKPPSTAPVPTAPPSSTAPATSAVPAGPAAPKQPAASSAPEQPPAPPSLDLAALEQRLRDTRAIGVFTKLSLKNQVDELLGQFRAYHRGDKKLAPPQLRQRYDGLLLKVLSVLQDGDPPLAAQIWASREAIWGVLADPAKFAKI